MKREEKKAQREEEILITALDLFTRKGYLATKTSEISQALGISEGLLFHYFKSKEVLLDALVTIAATENDSWIEKDNENPLQYFKDVADAVLNCLKEDDVAAKFFMLISQLKQLDAIPESIKHKIKKHEEYANKILPILIRGQEIGQIRAGDPVALLYLFNDTLQTIALNRAWHNHAPLPKSDWIIDMLKNHTST